MKPTHWIPPVLSLAIAGGLIGSQRTTIANLEEESGILRKRIEHARTGPGMAGDQSLATRMKEKGGLKEDEIDWKDLGGKLTAGRGQIPDMRAMMELQTRLMELSGDELLGELAKIDGLDLSKDVKQALDGMLIGLLAQKDPKAVLQRYSGRINDQDSSMSWQMSNAFQQWQKEDPAAALAWFDAEIAKGSFDSKSLDGRSDSRLRFEGAAIQGLLGSDLSEAKRRIEALPEDQRTQVFQQGMFNAVAEDSQQSYAELVRATVPEEKRGEAYSQTISMLMNGGGFEKVDGFIENIGASSDEKDAIVNQAANDRMQTLGREGKIDRAAVGEMREWAMAQSPDQVDAITGKSLANVWGNQSKFEDRVKLVEELHADGAGDELIMSFLGESQQFRKAPDLARSLAERVGDEEKRAELLKKIGGSSDSPPTNVMPDEVIIGN